jgi:hypothetical protein
MMVLLSCLGAVLVSGIGLYFVRENFRNARETGVIYIRGARYDRAEGEGWFRIAYGINWLVAAMFGLLGISGLVIGALSLLGKI